MRRQDLLGALAAVEGSSVGLAAHDRALLDSWGADVRGALEILPFASPLEQARELANVLGDQAGFQGDDADYYNSNNCLIHEVLERRRGMPILLSIVWMEVGKRASLTLSGVGMPGHFLVRVGGNKGVLADPFSGGSIVTIEDCRRTVRELSGGAFAWTNDFLSPSTTDQILERVLQNMAGSYSREEDEAGRFRAATFLSALRPDSPERLLERAEIAGSLGLRDMAAESYSELLERFPETVEAQQAADKLAEDDAPNLDN